MPNLTIIAGCNGAGKSTFATSFLPEGQISFDYDRIYLEYYNAMLDSELREKFAKDKANKAFEIAVERALQDQSDFCYETNFDVLPLVWAEKFKSKGYRINLIFFCIDTQDIARHRIQVRTEFKGHFVDNKTIDLKWRAGYKNVNLYFEFFDNILFVDNSKQNAVYTNILQLERGEFVLMNDSLPEYFKYRFPTIFLRYEV